MNESQEVSYFSGKDSPGERRIAGILRAFGRAGMGIAIAMMFLTIVQALGRYLFGRPVAGAVELTGLMTLTLCFLVGAYTQVVKGHIVIPILVDRLSPRAQAIIDSITYILSLVFVIVTIWRTVVEANYEMHGVYTTAILRIPHFPFLYLVAFGWGMLGLAILMHLIHFIPRAFRR